ncbi:hypothetical protein [Serinibacter arcticus]|uniref:hypothetical protein n=1 Tax=Serinibacter arcticus TaxID=1655435 RepID=UPI001F25ADCC|nr:hypothetical protein [Serinibacter arcticus]
MREERLDADAVLATITRLEHRIAARFPERGLTAVAGRLRVVATDVRDASRARDPLRLLRTACRIVIALLVLLMVAVVVLALVELVRQSSEVPALPTLEWLRGLETTINDAVFVGIAILFLWLLPTRVERTRVLRVLHRMRSLAHVIDMHQLTKDPERFSPAFRPTAETVDNAMTPSEMAGYLDYCSELLSLVGKTAALYAERTTDSAVLATISDIEALTTGMSRKIWQKVALLPVDDGAPRRLA